jgi:two-component system sensor histidine kinase AtoS
MAAAVSLVAIGLIAGLQHFVGYIPMLFLPAILLVESEWGTRPAVLSIVLCTLGSSLLATQNRSVDPKVYIWANLLLLPGIAASLLYLMEMRRRHQRIEHERGVELSILLQSMPEAVFIFDTAARVVESNRAAQVLAGLNVQQLHGMELRRLAQIVQAQENDVPVGYENLAVARALRGESIPYEARVLRDPADGMPMMTVLSANPMRDDEGNILGAVLVVRDITEITQLQTKVADTERHMAIGQMAAGIAHDFNNVLDTISQATAVMEMRHAGPEDNAKYLRMIQNAVRRGAEIINRVREYIRGGTGEQRAVSVCQVIEEAVELASPMWRELPNLTIERDLENTAPVLANPADLRRVFANLIINSIQAMPEGGRIVVRCTEANGHKVVASVSDNGPGIPAALQRKIFLPYFTTKSHGTGLGLSGAQRIVQSLGGNISFVSEPGKGTTFTIELPRLSSDNAEKTDTETPRRAA